MKNLKRLLSLALTGVMLSGMMVMGASAADFTDADEIVNTEAVDTMVALNIINGKDTGAFDPEGLVTRAEMAKMIATAVNGGVAPSFGVKATPTYTDTKGHWAEQFIEYCSDMKYINGRGNGTFDPNGNVTGTEAAKMVLTALGYESRAYQLTGADWAINTNALAMRDCKPSLYENLNGVSMNLPITRDTAAQLIWNGVQNYIVEYNPNVTITGTDITYGYEKSTTTTLLKQAYDANISTGRFEGNGKSISGLKDGQIRVNVTTENGATVAASNKTATADLDIAYVGENVKVIWKNEKNTPAGLDAKDKVYGVFTTGETTVYNITKQDITKIDTDDDTIKFDGVEHDYAVGQGNIVRNYGVSTVAFNEANLQALKADNADSIKFVCNTDGEIVGAYVVERTFDVVAAVTSSKVSLRNTTTLDIKDHEIYDDIAKNDIVVVTKLYNSNNADATFVVEKAELLTGTVTRYYESTRIAVDGTTIQQSSKAAAITDASGASNYNLTTLTNAALNEEYEFVMYGSRFVAAKQVSDTSKDYAVIITANEGDDINGQSVRILLADGTTKTFTIDEDSVMGNYNDMPTYFNVLSGQSTVAGGRTLLDESAGHNTLVSYTIQNDGKIKLNPLTTDSTATQYGGYTKNTKSVTTSEGNLTTSADAVAFIYFNGEWKVYNADTLENVTAEGTTSPMTIQYNKDGNRVNVFAMKSNAAVGVSTNDWTYMYITGRPAAYVENGDTYTEITGVGANGEELKFTMENDMTTNSSVARKNFIRYKEGSNGYVTTTNIDVITTVGRVSEYDEARHLLILEGVGSLPVATDVVIVNVNTGDIAAGSSAGISAADPVNTTWRNVAYLTETVNGVANTVVGVFVDDDRNITVNAVTLNGSTAAAVQNALYAGNVTVNKASITGAITVPAGRTLTISDAPDDAALNNITPAAAGAKLVVKAGYTPTSVTGYYTNVGTHTPADPDATPAVAESWTAATAQGTTAIANDSTYTAKTVYTNTSGATALAWVLDA